MALQGFSGRSLQGFTRSLQGFSGGQRDVIGIGLDAYSGSAGDFVYTINVNSASLSQGYFSYITKYDHTGVKLRKIRLPELSRAVNITVYDDEVFLMVLTLDAWGGSIAETEIWVYDLNLTLLRSFDVDQSLDSQTNFTVGNNTVYQVGHDNNGIVTIYKYALDGTSPSNFSTSLYGSLTNIAYRAIDNWHYVLSLLDDPSPTERSTISYNTSDAQVDKFDVSGVNDVFSVSSPRINDQKLYACVPGTSSWRSFNANSMTDTPSTVSATPYIANGLGVADSKVFVIGWDFDAMATPQYTSVVKVYTQSTLAFDSEWNVT